MLVEPNCRIRRCRHYRGVAEVGPAGSTTDSKLRPVCKAFPNGIPDDIAYGDDLHLDPVPNDHGIQFEEGDWLKDMQAGE